MFDKLKNFFKKPESEVVVQPTVEPQPKKERKPRKKKEERQLSTKELATANNEPFISIIKVEVDPKDINNGSFELDWNDKFILNLVRAGYKIKKEDTDQEIVDRWFQTVCRNIALEIYEQQQADPEKRNDVRVIQTRDIGNGRTEVS